MFLVHLRWGSVHEGGSSGSFGKSDDIPNGVSAGHEHDQTIETRCNPSVRRDPIFEGLQEKPKTTLNHLIGQPEDVEHLSQDLRTMNPDASAAQLNSVNESATTPAAMPWTSKGSATNWSISW